jgi:VanZ family protein
VTEITTQLLTGRSASRWRWLAPLAMMGAIFYFSAQPFDGPELEWWEVAIRKLGHVTGYALLTASFAWALAGSGVRRPLAWAALLAFAYACSDEYHQTFVESRSGTPVDVLVDSVGIAVSCAAMALYARRRRAASG